MLKIDLQKVDKTFDFKNHKLTIIYNEETKEQLFSALEVAKILEYSDTTHLTRYVKDKYKIKLSSKPTNIGGLRKGSVLLKESGLYQACMLSESEFAEEFQDWVLEEVLPDIRKNGYYITEEAKANPSKELIKEATSILTTRLGIDNTRDELIEYINQYLVDENWNTHSLPNALSSVYQHIHIAQRGMVASQILEEEFKSLKTSDMEITNHRQKRKLPAVYSSDYLVAQNYYSEKEVTAFNKRLNFILSRVKTHIEFKPKQLSPQSVIALLKKASRDMVYETSEQVFGTTYKGKNAKQLRKALYGFVEGSVEFEEALVLIGEVGDGNTFTLGKS